MKWIIPGDERVVRLLRRKEPDRQAKYRLCRYTYLFAENGAYLVFHTLSGQTAALTTGEWAALQQLRAQPRDFAFLEAHGLCELAAARVLVETDWDDPGWYDVTIRVLRSLKRERKGVRSYRILPTTGCNARCVYCYEEGLVPKTMTPATADRLAEYIDRTRWPEPVVLRWYGGEPLCAAPVISRVCRNLRERGVPFSSQITTNGTLLTEAMAEEAKTLWALEKAQLSMDGPRADYEKRKNFPQPDGTEYDRAMRAAELLLDRGIQVSMRVNCDAENQPRLRDFFDELKARFGGREGFTVYPALLNQTRFSEELYSLALENQRLLRYLDALGLAKKAEQEENVFKLQTHQCMADSMGKAVVVDPEGTVYACDYLPVPPPKGTIFRDDVPTDGAAGAAGAAEACRRCCFLPQCTPNFRANCPLWFDRCYESACRQQDDLLRRWIAAHGAEQT